MTSILDISSDPSPEGVLPLSEPTPIPPITQFQDALVAGDEVLRRQVWEHHPEHQDGFLIQALLHGIRLEALAGEYTLPNHWPQVLLTQERTARILSSSQIRTWMREQGWETAAFARTQLDLMEPQLAQIGNIPGRVRDYARRLLTDFPSVGREWFEEQPTRAGILAGLAMGRPQDTWLVKSEIELGQFLALVLAHDDLGRIVGAGQGEAASAWNQWISAQPELDQAWNNLRDDDADLIKQYDEWITTWLPDGLWGDSPLQVWLDGEQVEEGRPLDQAPFPEDAEDLTRDQQSAWVRKHFPVETFERLEGKAMLTQARKAIQQLIQDAWPDDTWLVLCKRPPSLAIEALARKKDWGWTGDNAKRSARELQAAIDDPRLESVLRKMGENSIVRVLAADPKPENWVGGTGKHLLDAWLEAQGNKAKLRANLVERLGEGHVRWMAEREDALTGGRKQSKFDYMGWQAAKTRLPTLAKQVKAAVGAKISQKIREEKRRNRANAPVDRTPLFAEPEQERQRKPADLSGITVAVRKRRTVAENGSPQPIVEPVSEAGGERSVLRIRR